jgi:hypothetical protein
MKGSTVTLAQETTTKVSYFPSTNFAAAKHLTRGIEQLKLQGILYFASLHQGLDFVATNNIILLRLYIDYW